MDIKRKDFHVITSPSGRYHSVWGRYSEQEEGEWHWLDGWRVETYRSLEQAQAEADRLNAELVA